MKLHYNFSSNPTAIQVSTTASINFYFSGKTIQHPVEPIVLEQLDIELPYGVGKNDLIKDTSEITHNITPNEYPNDSQKKVWSLGSSIRNNSLILTLKPFDHHNPWRFEDQGFPDQVFTISVTGLKINKKLGTCDVVMQETASLGTKKDKKTKEIKINKFPQNFSLSNFRAIDSTTIRKQIATISSGTPVWLAWEANLLKNSTLKLEASNSSVPKDKQDVTSCHEPGSNQYTYPFNTAGITINNDSVTFTLTGTYKDSDQTVLTTSLQYTVSLLPKITNFRAVDSKGNEVSVVSMKQPIWLTWVAETLDNSILTFQSDLLGLKKDVTSSRLPDGSTYKYPLDDSGIVISTYNFPISFDLIGGYSDSFKNFVSTTNSQFTVTVSDPEIINFNISPSISRDGHMSMTWSATPTTAYCQLIENGNVLTNQITGTNQQYTFEKNITANSNYKVRAFDNLGQSNDGKQALACLQLKISKFSATLTSNKLQDGHLPSNPSYAIQIIWTTNSNATCSLNADPSSLILKGQFNTRPEELISFNSTISLVSLAGPSGELSMSEKLKYTLNAVDNDNKDNTDASIIVIKVEDLINRYGDDQPIVIYPVSLSTPIISNTSVLSSENPSLSVVEPSAGPTWKKNTENPGLFFLSSLRGKQQLDNLRAEEERLSKKFHFFSGVRGGYK